MGTTSSSDQGKKHTHALGPLARFLADDHARLDALLGRALAPANKIDRAAYGEFRAGLLKHIGMEERILLPAAQRARGGEALPEAARLRLDHGALAALLVPTPTRRILVAIRTILEPHNALEEDPGGVYEVCEKLLGAEADAVLATLRTTLDVPLNPHVDSPAVRNATRRAVARAGFDPDAMKL